MDPLKYGKLLDKIGNKYFIQINNKNVAIITQLEYQNEVKFFKSGELTYEYIDRIINETSFVRILGKKEFIFNNNEFLTIDIETFLNDGVHIPYCISLYDGINTFSYYLTDYKSSEEMIIQAINSYRSYLF
jgi:hypothetical protein